MRLRTTTASEVRNSLRFDAKFFLDVGQAAHQRLARSKWPLVSVADTFGRNNIRLPNRFERVPAATREHGKPILVPYDCFRYLPYSNDILSRSQIAHFDKLEVERGWMLIVCSGRNLGPTTMVDSHLAGFVLTHDMIRITSLPSDELFYFAAFMHTAIGQALVRRDQHGSVIAHLNGEQVANLRYPLVGGALQKKCATAFRRAFELREQARLSLTQLSGDYLNLQRGCIP